MKTKLAEHSAGRIVLHLLCVLRGGDVRWHWAGMLREVHGQPRRDAGC